MKTRGHPIRGAIAGLFFGLFLSLDLLIFGVVALDADVLALLPILGLAAGLALGLTSPLKRSKAQAAAPPPAATKSEPEPAPTPIGTPEPDHTTV